MSHLSAAEFVDAVEGALPRSRAAHLESCARCREQAVTVRAALVSAKDGEMPEPSPLYWPHLSARIRERVARERIEPGWRAALSRMFAGRRLVPAVSAAVTIVALLGGAVLMKGRPPTVYAPERIVGTAVSEAGVEGDNAEVWQVLTSAAADMPIDDAHAAGMAVPAGAIDRAVQRLSPAELNELGRLLQSELRGSGD